MTVMYSMYCSTELHELCIYNVYQYSMYIQCVLCGIMLSYVILYVYSGTFWFCTLYITSLTGFNLFIVHCALKCVSLVNIVLLRLEKVNPMKRT